MCGICGKLNFSSVPVSPNLIQQMNQKMIHRGPDEEGAYLSPFGRFGMAMRRLKIIDLSTGSQPVFNETKDIAVILNGEIYNYLELRQELEKQGHTFTTQSDTETLVHAYEVYGLDFLSRLNGMFAFALWDQKKGHLILARDRMGIKPLYYRANSAGIAFASEIKALLADPECPREMDYKALDDYFSLLYVPGPGSIYKTVQKLEPGHYLICNAEKKTIVNRSYWEYPLVHHPKDLGWDYYREKLDELFRDSLKLQLRSDVPNGVFLSSGLDSGAIAYYASQVSSQTVKSFTVDFGESSYSERDGARKIAKQCGCEHHEIKLEYNVEEIILKTADYFDEPFADTSAIPTYLLCGFAKKNITVALSGEGGDELFAGYPTYIATQAAVTYRKVPRWLRKMIASMVQRIPVSWERLSWEYRLKEFIRGAEFLPQESHYQWKEIFSEELKAELYTEKFLKNKNWHHGFESFVKVFEKARLLGGQTDRVDLETLLFADQQTYLPDQFLVKSDRMSMAHALEVRVPILDHRIVEFAAQIPAQYKLRGMTTKWALRKLMEGRLPEEIVRGGKKGFSPPIPYWIAGKLRKFVEDKLSPDSIRKTGVLNPHVVSHLLQEHLAKKRDHHRRIWAILNFVLWQQKWSPPC
jgi:asparagine synthase (glutamine-hydrolysing)